jgi:hypothetical protein
MDATTLLITVYCLIDDWLAGQRLRQRGPTPVLSDSEVLTIECVGEFFGIDTDKGLYEHFSRHYRDWFPALGRIHRTTFVMPGTCGHAGSASCSATPWRCSCVNELASARSGSPTSSPAETRTPG